METSLFLDSKAKRLNLAFKKKYVHKSDAVLSVRGRLDTTNASAVVNTSLDKVRHARASRSTGGGDGGQAVHNDTCTIPTVCLLGSAIRWRGGDLPARDEAPPWPWRPGQHHLGRGPPEVRRVPCCVEAQNVALHACSSERVSLALLSTAA